MKPRLIVVCVLVLLVAASHWITPIDNFGMYVLHVILRKLFIVPIILAGIWYGLRGSLLAVLAATILYLPHVAIQWSNLVYENTNQVGELVTMWIIALLTGVFVRREVTMSRRLAKSSEGALLALIGTMDARQLKRQYHTMRVFAYADRLARELNLPPEDLDTLARVSVLHDLGMISSSDAHMSSAAQFDGQQPDIRKHPLIGYNIIRCIPSLREVAEIVYAHHERYDGTGYPRGLQKDEIPRLARVFAVADVLDALTTASPYNQAISFEEAGRVIAGECGKDFDPWVVNAFLCIPLTEWPEILQRLESNRDLENRPIKMGIL